MIFNQYFVTQNLPDINYLNKKWFQIVHIRIIRVELKSLTCINLQNCKCIKSY